MRTVHAYVIFDAITPGVVVVVAVVVCVRENVCNNSKNVKSRVFWILRKTVKNVKNARTVSGAT